MHIRIRVSSIETAWKKQTHHHTRISFDYPFSPKLQLCVFTILILHPIVSL